MHALYTLVESSKLHLIWCYRVTWIDARNSVLWLDLVENSQIILFFFPGCQFFFLLLKPSFSNFLGMCRKKAGKEEILQRKVLLSYTGITPVWVSRKQKSSTLISTGRLRSLTLGLNWISLGSSVYGVLPWALIIYYCKDYWLSDNTVVWVTVFQ